MSALRITGLIASIIIAAFVIRQYRRRNYHRGEFLLGLLIAGALAAVSLNPSLADGITSLFEAETRLLALAIVSNIVLFALFLFSLREISSLRSSLGELVQALAREEYEQSYKNDDASEIVVVVPAFDEEANLEFLLPQIPASVDGKSISTIVIVDGARDRSADVARKYATPVSSHAINRGGGAAVRTGFELALRTGAEIVVTMDADGQHTPDEIGRLAAPIFENQADVVIGNRFSGSYAERGSTRHAGIIVFSLLVSILSGSRIHNSTNGFRAIRSSGLAMLDLREQQFHTAEFILEASRNKLRIVEAPVSVMKRHEGKSKKPRGFRYPLGFAWTLVKVWLRS